ncbi:hypothetical protein [Roseomonas indoligenes]|uniref:Uncharacterized protein n=1 Tax=Roseomonas indoligenes TaxID=2820811 RepID=A0A940S778_9PROT|nr:hypothetical protein [Pararoseomonas indoligenes]MBP0494789.1 hypothetical protein [Pararoseomonas indoligenes]
MPPDLPNDGLNLLLLQEADVAISAAAARARADALRARMETELDALPPPMRDVVERLIDAIGEVSAGVEAARQVATEFRRDRGDWLQIDPLRHIPEDRGVTPPPPPARFELNAADPDFVGYGWYGPEGQGRDSRRWSGQAAAASIVIPDLGPGAIALEIHLELPFGVPFAEDSITVLANGEPLDITMAEADANRAVLRARWDGFEAAGANLGLVLLGSVHADPGGRDTRRLGVGFRRLIAAPAALEG